MQRLVQVALKWTSRSKASFLSLMENWNGGGIGLSWRTAMAAPNSVAAEIAATRCMPG